MGRSSLPGASWLRLVMKRPSIAPSSTEASSSASQLPSTQPSPNMAAATEQDPLDQDGQSVQADQSRPGSSPSSQTGELAGSKYQGQEGQEIGQAEINRTPDDVLAASNSSIPSVAPGSPFSPPGSASTQQSDHETESSQPNQNTEINPAATSISTLEPASLSSSTASQLAAAAPTPPSTPVPAGTAPSSGYATTFFKSISSYAWPGQPASPLKDGLSVASSRPATATTTASSESKHERTEDSQPGQQTTEVEADQAKSVQIVTATPTKDGSMAGQDTPPSPHLERASTAPVQTAGYGYGALYGWWGGKSAATGDAATPALTKSLATQSSDSIRSGKSGSSHSSKDTSRDLGQDTDSGAADKPIDEPSVDDVDKDTDKGTVKLPSPKQSYWFGLWKASVTGQEGSNIVSVEQIATPVESEPAQPPADAAVEASSSQVTETVASPQKPDSKKSSWGFWTGRSGKSTGSTTEMMVGELVVENTSSEHHPQKVAVEVDSAAPTKNPTGKLKAAKNKDTVKLIANPAVSKEDSGILLPPMADVFPHIREHGYHDRVRKIIFGPPSPTIRVERSAHVARITKAIVIGVHGWFPERYLRTIIGHPTGTSVLFATKAAEAVKRWAGSNGQKCEVERIMLEGDGNIETRVNDHWDVLQTWVDKIRDADFVLVASHSQGVPVSIQLLARLIDGNHVRPSTRVGVCAMAGVNMGPYQSLAKSIFFNDSAQQLFEFAKPSSQVSSDYQAALGTVISKGGKVTFVGSADDWFVPLDSGTYMGVLHPHIYRAVFFDSTRKLTNSPFIKHLLNLTYTAVNRGTPDCGFIQGLSRWIAPSSLEERKHIINGHSALYFCPKVYDTAVQFALETTSVAPASLMPKFETRSWSPGWKIPAMPYLSWNSTSAPSIKPEFYIHKRQPDNPSDEIYASGEYLVWSLCSLLSQPAFLTTFKAESDALREMYNDWNPPPGRLKPILAVLRCRL